MLRLLMFAIWMSLLPVMSMAQENNAETSDPPENTAVEVVEDVDFNQETVDQGKQIFNTRCSACHKIGGGQLVGPDLVNIGDKREKDWLIGFIQNSQELIAAGDEDAVAVFNEYNQTVMPPHPDLDEEKITAIMEYIAFASAEVQGAIASVDGQMPKDAIPTFAGPGLRPTDLEFRLIFWFSAFLIVVMSLILGTVIAKYSKNEPAPKKDNI